VRSLKSSASFATFVAAHATKNPAASDFRSTANTATEELVAMSEQDLQSRVVEPLLRKMGFRNVQVNAGPQELGKDLVATKIDDFGELVLYSIQLKKFKPSAKVGTNSSFGRLLDQLRQAIQEPVTDLATKTQRRCDACIFITPYPIPPRVREAFQEQLKEPVFNILKIVDGGQLVDLIQQHLHDELALFSAEVQYRFRVAADANRILESPIALETNELKLDDLYVDASLAQKDTSLEHLRLPGTPLKVSDSRPS
jgi:hypothetical protein